jgi:hypothetical protein
MLLIFDYHPCLLQTWVKWSPCPSPDLNTIDRQAAELKKSPKPWIIESSGFELYSGHAGQDAGKLPADIIFSL